MQNHFQIFKEKIIKRTCLHSTRNAHFYLFCEPFHFLNKFSCSIYYNSILMMYICWLTQCKKNFWPNFFHFHRKNNSILKNMQFLVQIMPDIKQNSKISFFAVKGGIFLVTRFHPTKNLFVNPFTHTMSYLFIELWPWGSNNLQENCVFHLEWRQVLSGTIWKLMSIVWLHHQGDDPWCQEWPCPSCSLSLTLNIQKVSQSRTPN